jgi:hypothetical protein
VCITDVSPHHAAPLELQHRIKRLSLLSLSTAGGGEDELFMPNPNELHIITKIWVDDDPSSPKQARQVYRRIA